MFTHAPNLGSSLYWFLTPVYTIVDPTKTPDQKFGAHVLIIAAMIHSTKKYFLPSYINPKAIARKSTR